MLPLYAFMDKQEKHSMQRRSPGNNYTHPGIYHITITISDRKAQSLGRVIGDVQYPDGNPNAPRVELTAIGKMVEYELLHSISYHYPFIEVQDYIIMPEHMHFILNKGCNHRYWEIIGQGEVAAKPLPTPSPPSIER